MCALWRRRRAAHTPRVWHTYQTRLLSDTTESSTPQEPLSATSPTETATRRSKGLHFENQVVTLMRAFRCELQPTQMSNDGGIDHQAVNFGLWTLPDLQVEIVTQCKNEAKPVGVQHLREFHGVLSFFPPNAIGMFASASGYSIYAQRYFLRMPHPAILCTIESERLSSFLLNDRAQTLLPKLTIGTIFVNHEHELVLTYGDQILG
uniref:Restriction endonuclease type IV Mrr domain-containing protein n=1 Tax=Globisporangium ultimum (strain ATCC 200006 / CBS 805.95 / DAOM BR144) TaxID=431595 RepID=K3W530_GLOUD